MKLHWSDLFVGKNGKVSRTALAFVVWFIFLVGLIGYSTYKNDGKLPDVPQPYVYLTMVFCGTYTVRRYLDGKLETLAPKANEIIPPKVP